MEREGSGTRNNCKGYGFVNFTSITDASEFCRAADGYRFTRGGSNKRAQARGREGVCVKQCAGCSSSVCVVLVHRLTYAMSHRACCPQLLRYELSGTP